jgi:hypothetical protein
LQNVAVTYRLKIQASLFPEKYWKKTNNRKNQSNVHVHKQG